MSTFSELVNEGLYPNLLATFGDETTYAPRTGDSYTLTCVLDSGEAVQTAERVYQTAWAPLSSFEAEPVRGDLITIDDREYVVSSVEKQHLDGRLLKLSLAKP